MASPAANQEPTNHSLAMQQQQQQQQRQQQELIKILAQHFQHQFYQLANSNNSNGANIVPHQRISHTTTTSNYHQQSQQQQQQQQHRAHYTNDGQSTGNFDCLPGMNLATVGITTHSNNSNDGANNSGNNNQQRLPAAAIHILQSRSHPTAAAAGSNCTGSNALPLPLVGPPPALQGAASSSPVSNRSPLFSSIDFTQGAQQHNNLNSPANAYPAAAAAAAMSAEMSLINALGLNLTNNQLVLSLQQQQQEQQSLIIQAAAKQYENYHRQQQEQAALVRNFRRNSNESISQVEAIADSSISQNHQGGGGGTNAAGGKSQMLKFSINTILGRRSPHSRASAGANSTNDQHQQFLVNKSADSVTAGQLAFKIKTDYDVTETRSPSQEMDHQLMKQQQQQQRQRDCDQIDSGDDSSSSIDTSSTPTPQQQQQQQLTPGDNDKNNNNSISIFNHYAQTLLIPHEQHNNNPSANNNDPMASRVNQPAPPNQQTHLHHQSNHHHHSLPSFLAATSAGAFPWTVAARGKPRRGMMRRAVFSDSQRVGLEKRFQLQKYISKPDRKKLAEKLGLRDSQVKIWFQNRRMKWRNSKERELLSAGGSREQTLPTRNNPNPDLSDVGETIKRLTGSGGTAASGGSAQANS